MNIYLSNARDLVLQGIENSGVRLSHSLEFHLSATLARFIDRPVSPEKMTYRLAEITDGKKASGEIRQIGDECLIGCAFFRPRIKYVGGSVRHYSRIGATAYDHAGMTEAALGFPHMLDVLCGIQEKAKDPILDLIERARAGSVAAREGLRRDGVLVFRR